VAAASEYLDTLFSAPELTRPGVKPKTGVRQRNPNFYAWLFNNDAQPVNGRLSVNNGATFSTSNCGRVAVLSGAEHISTGITEVSSYGWVQVKYRTTSAARENIFGGGGSSGEPFRLSLNYRPGVGGSTAGYIGLSPYYNNAPAAWVDVGATLYDGNFHTIDMHWDGDTIYCMFDGVLQSLTYTNTTTFTGNVFPQALDIGRDFFTGAANYYFNGDLNHVFFGNRCKYLAGRAQSLYYDPYQVLAPSWSVAMPAPDAGGSTLLQAVSYQGMNRMSGGFR
jgi:hypothetical protein